MSITTTDFNEAEDELFGKPGSAERAAYEARIMIDGLSSAVVSLDPGATEGSVRVQAPSLKAALSIASQAVSDEVQNDPTIRRYHMQDTPIAVVPNEFEFVFRVFR